MADNASNRAPPTTPDGTYEGRDERDTLEPLRVAVNRNRAAGLMPLVVIALNDLAAVVSADAPLDAQDLNGEAREIATAIGAEGLLP